MKAYLLALFTITALLCNNGVYAQTNQWVIKSGANIKTALPIEVRFHYPQFMQGIVVFRDGTTSAALLNFNLVSNEMQFVAPKGDTLAVANEFTIKYIAIGSDTFFYDKTFLQLVAANNKAKLAKNETLAIRDVKKSGAYDQYSSTSAITSLSSMTINGQFTNLTEDRQLVVFKATLYYIGDTYNHFLQASKKNITRLFGQKQNAVEQYLKEHKVLFNKEEDSKALISFLENQ